MHIEIVGDDLSNLNNESGGHRIQRVPPTERKGRVHTSTVTVAIVDPSIPKFELKESDFRVEWFSGTGCGGQNRNKTQNSCRLIHTSGIVVTAQTRSRINSYNEAMDTMKKKLMENTFMSHSDKVSIDRKNQVGSGQRGDKIRTYRFQDDIVTDHNTGLTANCTKVMKGGIDLLWK